MELLGPVLLPLVDLQPTLGDVDGVHGWAGRLLKSLRMMENLMWDWTGVEVKITGKYHEADGGDLLRLVDEVVGHDGGQVFGEGGVELIEGIRLLHWKNRNF